MGTLTPTQKRRLKRMEEHHAEQTQVHEELRSRLDGLQRTFDEQQAIIDTLSIKPGDEHATEIEALTNRIERVKHGTQVSWARLAELEQELRESKQAIDELSAATSG